MKPIPVFEPEVIAAGARKRRGDDEKVATTACRDITSRGIKLVSRYRKQIIVTVQTGIAAHVRFGSKADIRIATSHVRFTPESGHWPQADIQ
jgi:hypothetical protein